ncbi:MAG: helix-turn-helix transcriptional regulator [Parerythrobacter sp.]
MKFGEALKTTLEHFGLTAAELSSQSGVAGSRLSRFFNGYAITTDGLEQVWEALDDEAFNFMLEKIVIHRPVHLVPERKQTLSEQVQRLSPADQAELLTALAAKIRADSEVQTKNGSKVLATSQSGI